MLLAQIVNSCTLSYGLLVQSLYWEGFTRVMKSPMREGQFVINTVLMVVQM